ncbi:unnamed protein product, partial [Ectocarpus sp. 12 AP-2014]
MAGRRLLRVRLRNTSGRFGGPAGLQLRAVLLRRHLLGVLRRAGADSDSGGSVRRRGHGGGGRECGNDGDGCGGRLDYRRRACRDAHLRSCDVWVVAAEVFLVRGQPGYGTFLTSVGFATECRERICCCSMCDPPSVGSARMPTERERERGAEAVFSRCGRARGAWFGRRPPLGVEAVWRRRG